MPLSKTARLETFARLIALGYPPVLAAKAAGYRNLRASRAARRIPPPPALDEAKAPRAAPAKARAKAPKAAAEAPPPRPPLEPMMTEAEWLAAFHPRYRSQTPART